MFHCRLPAERSKISAWSRGYFSTGPGALLGMTDGCDEYPTQAGAIGGVLWF